MLHVFLLALAVVEAATCSSSTKPPSVSFKLPSSTEELILVSPQVTKFIFNRQDSEDVTLSASGVESVLVNFAVVTPTILTVSVASTCCGTTTSAAAPTSQARWSVGATLAGSLLLLSQGAFSKSPRMSGVAMVAFILVAVSAASAAEEEGCDDSAVLTMSIPSTQVWGTVECQPEAPAGSICLKPVDFYPALHISEVAEYATEGQCEGADGQSQDWVELYNAHATDAVDLELAGLSLCDSKVCSALTGKMAAGEYRVMCKGTDFTFGISGNEMVSLYDGETIDSTTLGNLHYPKFTWARRPDGTFGRASAATPGAENIFGPTTDSVSLYISEIADKGTAGQCVMNGKPQDWVELHNAGDVLAVLSNASICDSQGCSVLTGTLAVGAYRVLCRGIDFAFGIGGGDTVSLTTSQFTDSTKVGIGGQLGVSWARQTDDTFAFTSTPTPGAGNTFSSLPPPTISSINIDCGDIDTNITKEYVPGSLQLDGVSYDISIKVRGMSSRYFAKHSYGIQFRNSTTGDKMKVSFVGLNQGDSFILYGPSLDRSLLRNAITYKLWLDAGHWTGDYRWVELNFNGTYHGLYLVIEKITRHNIGLTKNEDCLDFVDGIPTGGYIIEVNRASGTANPMAMVDYPSSPTNETRDWILEQVRIAFQSGLDSIIVQMSMVEPVSAYDYILFQEITGNIDGFQFSNFFSKDCGDPQFNIGPVWDFNIAMANNFGSNTFPPDMGWMCQVFKYHPMSNLEYWLLLKDSIGLMNRWRALRQSTLNMANIRAHIEKQSAVIKPHVPKDKDRWKAHGKCENPATLDDSWEEQVARMFWYLKYRALWMDEQLCGKLCGVDDGAETWLDTLGESLANDKPLVNATRCRPWEGNFTIQPT